MRVSLLAAATLLAAAARSAAKPNYSLGAFYYGPWHQDPTNEKLHGKNWTEWNLVKHAQPRFPGHMQPNVPLWGYEMDNDPTVMAKKIDAAADHGIDHFLFDWYWYNETSTNGQPGLFQDSALEDGFLAAPNRHRLKFALMWASQEWMDVHPSVGPFVSYGNRTPTFIGAINRETFDHMTDHIVSRYMSQPNYLRVQTKPNGPKCAFFSIYEVGTFVAGQGGEPQAKAALDAFRAKAKAAGEECLHISSQGGAGSTAQAKALGLDSAANYCWYHTTGNVLNAPENFPVTPHAAMLNGSVKAWHDMTSKWNQAGYPYIPNLSVQWDSSPRTVVSDTFELGGYPFTGTFRSTPDEWKTALQAGKQFLDATCKSDGTWCPMTINAWNEWSEGAYIEPDVRYGTAKLEAIKAVFGADSNQAPASKPHDPISIGAIRWDAWYGEHPGNAGVVGRTVTEDLSYHAGKAVDKWHYRVPFFGSYHSKTNASLVDVNGNSPEVMSEELKLAHQFGIDFWAYCIYPFGCKDYDTTPASECSHGMQCCSENYMLSYALKQHLASPDAHLVNFSLILQGAPAYHVGDGGGGWFPSASHGGNETLEQEVDRFVGYFQLDFYHKVMGGRPLVFLLDGANDNRTVDGIKALQAATKAKLGVSCYLVYMGSGAGVKVVGGDAVSQYMVASNGAGGVPFEIGIGQPERQMWSSARSAGLKLIPSITAGSDSRPRQEYPLPWGRRLLSAVTDEGETHRQHTTASTYDFATESTSTAPFCAVAHQASAPPFSMGVVTLSCADQAATIQSIMFADFGAVNVSGGCGHFISSRSCTTATFTQGWSHHCVGKHECTLDSNDLQPPKRPDPCGGVPKVFAIEATCSGSAGGKGSVAPAPPPPPPGPHAESFVVDPTLAELQEHTEDAIEFAIRYEDTVEARAVLISAWNENDEGHWVVPSLMNGTQKMEAVQAAINATKARHADYYNEILGL